MNLVVIPELPNYGVSRHGKVYRIDDKLHRDKRVKRYEIVPLLSNGVAYVNLYKNGECHRRHIHRLVAELFVKKRSPSNHYVLFRDGVKANLRASNLYWCNTPYPPKGKKNAKKDCKKRTAKKAV